MSATEVRSAMFLVGLWDRLEEAFNREQLELVWEESAERGGSTYTGGSTAVAVVVLIQLPARH